MDFAYLGMVVVRWLHILAGAVALGVPLYMRFVLLPALGTLDDTTRGQFHEALLSRWRKWVHVLIVVLLATGFYTFLGVARWKNREVFSPDARFMYHMLFGVKVLIALGMFFISSALAGRSAAFAGIRANGKAWVNLLVLLGLILVTISGVLRFLPLPYPSPLVPPV